ncbi:BLUF domain-containing protein [Psychrobacter sp. I-STPA10]|uniref:BLUF domain-containing protein n=1 Tax=Psychrobacter sp. I-STPA10 TaxID=2585769 RepID=UPI001E50EFA8|nr:BLUF domain-containing protein [Psychrobacter sp. I-STPA10]
MNNKKALSCHQHSLYQLVYISQIKDNLLPIQPVLNDIAVVSAQQNDKNNLTGVLFYGNGWFFQYLEGSKYTLQQLKENLIRDGRHYNVNFLEFSHLAQRRFSSWSMQLLASEKPIANAQQVSGIVPFKPAQWQLTEWQDFLQALIPNQCATFELDITSSFDRNHNKENKTKMIIEFLERHVAFVSVQVVLSLLITLSIYLLIVSD